jgi:hypothetical protein
LQVSASAVPGTSIVEQSASWGKASSSLSLTLPDNNSDTKFVLYITDGILNIKYGKPQELTNGEVIVYNLLGQEIVRKKLETIPVNQITLSVQNTCYIVKISYSGKIHTQKVIPSSF